MFFSRMTKVNNKGQMNLKIIKISAPESEEAAIGKIADSQDIVFFNLDRALLIIPRSSD